MKNITVSVDEETHRMARIRAAELDTSVSALVRDYLRIVGGRRICHRTRQRWMAASQRTQHRTPRFIGT